MDSPQTLLLIDDDEAVRDSTSFLLSTLLHVDAYPSAEEGIQHVSETTSVVVLDIKMKNKDGFWAAEQIQRDFPDVPIIFFSAFQDLKDPMRIINDHRPFAFVSKGDSPEQLMQAVRRAVAMSERINASRAMRKRLRDLEARMSSLSTTERPR